MPSAGLGSRAPVVNPLMRLTSHRSVLGILLGALAATLGAASSPQTGAGQAAASWARGVEGQRKADLGNGTFLNPVLAGDHPDPSILKDGDDYYLTYSSFDAYPGLVIWHSRDLVNWKPVGAGAVQERRVGLGPGHRQARRAVLHLLPRPDGQLPVELRGVGRQDRGAVERSHRSQGPPDRPGPHRRRRRPAVPVPQRRVLRATGSATACR